LFFAQYKSFRYGAQISFELKPIRQRLQIFQPRSTHRGLRVTSDEREQFSVF
jgi:hypothetical protein